MSIFNANYNPITKKVENCKEGTLVHFHELRHKQQDEKGLMGHYLASLYPLLVPLSFLVMLGIDYSWMFVIAFCLFLMHLELDAWVWAFKKRWF